MKPFVEILDDPEIKRMIDTAVEWTKHIFGEVLPNSFKAFLTNVDMGVMDTIMVMFTEWLPKAARGLAIWGSKLFKEIGAGSLGRLNKLFKYLAGGLQSTAEWLNKGGFEQLDSLSSMLGQLMSQLMELGKTVLPILVETLKTLYPFPIKPIIDTLISFFESIRDSEVGTRVIKAMAQMFVGLLALKGLESFLVAFNGLATILVKVIAAVFSLSAGWAIVLAAILVFGTAGLLWLANKSELARKILVTLGVTVINVFTFMYNSIAVWVSNIKNLFNWLTGNDERVDYTKEYRQLKYNTGENIWGTPVNDMSVQQQEVKVEVVMDENVFGMGILDFLSADVTQHTGGN